MIKAINNYQQNGREGEVITASEGKKWSCTQQLYFLSFTFSTPCCASDIYPLLLSFLQSTLLLFLHPKERDEKAGLQLSAAGEQGSGVAQTDRDGQEQPHLCTSHTCPHFKGVTQPSTGEKAVVALLWQTVLGRACSCYLGLKHASEIACETSIKP